MSDVADVLFCFPVAATRRYFFQANLDGRLK